jgi:3-hydroxyisobutyrate dehydrogenase-like beta-hydroxyacid dehydrogenase
MKTPNGTTIGWVGAGRMGAALVERLLRAGCDVSVYNRTRAKAEALTTFGATVVGASQDLGDRDIVITMVSSSDDLLAIVDPDEGLLSGGSSPGLLVDCSTVSMEASREARRRAGLAGVPMLAAPVSGNPKVARAGRLTLVVSGPRESFDTALPFLELMGAGVTYVGEGETARLVKICHNLLLGIVAQTLAEITVLAERGGVARSDLMHFINDSVMGSAFTRYKTPAFVNLDYTPTFTGELLRKDLQLGLDAGNTFDVPLPLTALVHEILTDLIEQGLGELDFAALIEVEARKAGLELRSEDLEVGDGLTPEEDGARR